MFGAPGGAISGTGGAVGAGVPPVSTAPPVGASAPTSNLFTNLMGAMFDPKNAALAMAKDGMSPEMLQKGIEKSNKLANVMQSQRAPDSGMQQQPQSMLGDLMKPIGQPEQRGKMLDTLGTQIAPQGIQAGKGQAQPNPMSGVFTQEKAVPSVSEMMQPLPGATEKVAGQSPPTWRGVEQVPTAQGQPPIAPPVQLPIKPPPATLPEAIREFLHSSMGPRESIMGGTPSEGTVTGTTPQSSGTVTGGTSPAGTVTGGVTSDGQLSPLGGQLLQPSPLQAQSVQPTWSGQTSYQLHGGATRADALKNMDRQFMQQLEEMYGAAPPEVQKELGLTSAFRDVETQRRLWEQSDKSGKRVAQPGGSRHNFGKAADLYGFGMGKEKVSPETRKWVQQNAKSFGLGFPVAGEPWHIEQISPEGKRVPLTSPGILPDEIARRGSIPQFDLEQRAPTGAQGANAVRGLRPEYRQWMQEIGQSYGVDPNYLQRIAMIESSGNPNAKNPSGATGLMQFMPGTAKQYRLENPLDPKDSIRAASELAMDNAKSLEKALGRKPSWAEVYLAHQQGSGGAAALLKNPDGMAVNTLGRDAVIGNGGTSGMTNQEFANLWIDKYNGTGSGKGGGGGGGEGDTTSSIGEQFGPTYTPGENPLNQYPAAPAMADGLDKIPYKYKASDNKGTSGQEKLIDPPNAIAPSQGAYRPDSDMMKLMMMMLMAGGGGQIPTIGQIMSGGVGGGRGQANG